MPRLAGAKMALEMCIEGKPVAAPKAQATGIIDDIVDGDLLTGAIAFAKTKASTVPIDHRAQRQRDRYSSGNC